jgi:hypothetical protein
MEVIIEHKTEILAVLLAVSELLAAIPAVKANSLFQLAVGLIKKIAGK